LPVVPTIVVAIAIALIAVIILTRRGVRWGASVEERATQMPGDEYFAGGPPVYLAMTRAVSIAAPPETVWPWLAQLGRGAGFYSLDRLDNGGKTSARHVISWVPPPQPGDAAAIGYLRRVVPGRELTWWAPGASFLGAVSRLATDVSLRPEESGSRLVIRMSADAAGLTARPAMWVFMVIDSIMARRQLLGIKERAEKHGARGSAPERPETGARDQYQLYETIFASGEKAGVPGKEEAARWRRVAEEDGLIPVAESPFPPGID